MRNNEFPYEKEGPEDIIRAFSQTLRGLLVKKGFQETVDRMDPGGPDAYIFEKDDLMISVTLTQRGPGTLVIAVGSESPVKNAIIEEAVAAFLEGIRILLLPKV